MNGFMSSLINNTKNNFVVAPHELLEPKETMVIDGQQLCYAIHDYAEELFVEPELGVFKKNSCDPLITAYEKLYTHPNAYEFFPEITSPVFTHTQDPRKAAAMMEYQGEVGKRVTWREAIENPINVYNSVGRLLLKSNESRTNLLFNPGCKVYTNRFVSDLARYAILQTTSWGDETAVHTEMEKYLGRGVDPGLAVSLGLASNPGFFATIKEFVSRDPWSIYFVTNIGTNLMIESSCDYRHYKCNQVMWDELHKKDPDYEVLETFTDTAPVTHKIKFEDLDEFFSVVNQTMTVNITSITELFGLLEATKDNKYHTKKFLQLFDNFLKAKKNQKTRTTGIIHKIIKTGNGHHSFNFNEGTGIYFL